METGAPNRLSSLNGNILKLLILTEILQAAPISTLHLPEAFACPPPAVFHAYKVCLICKTVSTTNWQPNASSLKDVKAAVKDDTGTMTSLLGCLGFKEQSLLNLCFPAAANSWRKGLVLITWMINANCHNPVQDVTPQASDFEPSSKDRITCLLPLG